ncbi:hypothetical protein PUW24_10230 [Paenibacillus urinalis]|uniref:Lipoprotein n=1 Tax=Paenibacillus urinalis TaxID=521520 RepID=A0AAX3MZT1_9BACL|nr:MULTISPECIES: hypothetical protein [Paenibacillus]WDH83140.1 hypothetical protein PUW23_02520 [Paenibacillus urinalis]WDH99222.1 hypothetical protein PUW24_10230 [Paenibacillus urinalis]WDI02913.1 hypothetical protein PUW25_02675 [Paenibacillus urinalis]
MKRCFLAISSLFILVVFMMACGNNSNSSASILIYSGQEYIGQNVISSDQYPDKDLLGTISTKTDSNQIPQEDFSSNELTVGTKIYSLEDGILGAEVEENKLKLFNLKK